MVPLKGIKWSNEIIDIMEYSKSRGIKVRYIEYMENSHAIESLQGMHGKEILAKIKEKYKMICTRLRGG